MNQYPLLPFSLRPCHLLPLTLTTYCRPTSHPHKKKKKMIELDCKQVIPICFLMLAAKSLFLPLLQGHNVNNKISKSMSQSQMIYDNVPMNHIWSPSQQLDEISKLTSWSRTWSTTTHSWIASMSANDPIWLFCLWSLCVWTLARIVCEV